MTAPIVRHSRPLLTDRELELFGYWWADADGLNRFLPAERPAGQLWERLAEYAENHT